MTPLAFIQNLGTWDIIAILLIVLLLFGAKRLPELAQGMGKSLREFKKAATEAEESFRDAVNTENEKKEKEKQQPQALPKEQTPAPSVQAEKPENA